MSAADRIRAFLAGLKRLSSLGIIAANAVPIVCVILFGWPAGVLLLLYWCENVAIGAVNVLKIAGASLAFGRVGLLVGAFVIPFFTVHYGLFCFVHGIFVMFVGSMGASQPPDFDLSPMGLYRVVEGMTHSQPGFLWSLAAIAGWQLVNFVTDWLAKGRFRETNPLVQMFEPYGRIVVLHLALFAGTVPVVLLGNPMWAIVALAVIKTLFDLGRMDQFKPTDETLAKSNESFEELRQKLQGRR